MSKDTIFAPELHGESIGLPFYPGCRYAAIPGDSINNVRNLFINDAELIFSIYQVVEVEIYRDRPACLVYYDHSFHLMDFQIGGTRIAKVGFK